MPRPVHRNRGTALAVKSHSREPLAKRVLEHGPTLKWVRRYRERGKSDLGDRSSRHLRSLRRTASALSEQVLALRRLRYNGLRIAIDDHSRIGFAAILPDQTSASGEPTTQIGPWLHDYNNFPRPQARLNLNPPASRSGLNPNNLLSLHRHKSPG